MPQSLNNLDPFGLPNLDDRRSLDSFYGPDHEDGPWLAFGGIVRDAKAPIECLARCSPSQLRSSVNKATTLLARAPALAAGMTVDPRDGDQHIDS
jgi:hypothetical protein